MWYTDPLLGNDREVTIQELLLRDSSAKKQVSTASREQFRILKFKLNESSLIVPGVCFPSVR
jgi:hypothetical protein